MFGYELTLTQKIEVGIFLVILVVAGIIFYTRNFAAQVDTAITAYTERHEVGVDPRIYVGPSNPADPSKTQIANVFAFYDGKLSVVEYTPESGYQATVDFEPDDHRTKYVIYKDPWDPIYSMKDKDAYKRTLTFAAMCAIDGQARHVLDMVRMDQSQAAQEVTFRKEMNDQRDFIEDGAKMGTFNSDLHKKLMDVLNRYRTLEGDPAKDKTKAAAARQVIDVGMAYLDKMNKARLDAITKYVNQMDGILQQAQKDTLAKYTLPPERQVNAGSRKWQR